MAKRETASSFAFPDAAAPGTLARPMTETERNYSWSVLILAVSIALFAAIQAFEMDLGRWNANIRLVPEATEAAMRYISLSHILLAFLYIATSKRMRTIKSWGRFTAMLGVGALLCVGYARLDTFNQLLAGFFFFGYFLAHDVRDQVFFYFTNGDAPPPRDRAALTRILVWAPFLAIALVLTVPMVVTVVGAATIAPVQKALTGISQPVRWGLVVILLAATALGIWRLTSGWKRENPGRVALFLRTHRPILLVFAAMFLVLIAGIAIGGHPYTINTIHVAAWYVFTMAQLKKRPPAAPVRPFTWNWFRGTRPGFTLMHAGSAVLFIAAGVVWAYGFRNDPGLPLFNLVLDKDLFRYWTILHITVSFSPR